MPKKHQRLPHIGEGNLLLAPKTRKEYCLLFLNEFGQIRKTPPITEKGNYSLFRKRQRPMGDHAEHPDKDGDESESFGCAQRSSRCLALGVKEPPSVPCH